MNNTNKKKSILAVDDDSDILLQTKVNLEAAGYEVSTAESAKEAEALLQSYKPDLAVLDLMMETQDSGFILSYKIKKIDPSIPVIIVTAVTSQTGIAFDLTGSGESSWIMADAIIEKPIRYEQLLSEVKRLLP
jgi:DNA-binding NtrC family response regulator